MHNKKKYIAKPISVIHLKNRLHKICKNNLKNWNTGQCKWLKIDQCKHLLIRPGICWL